MNKNMNYVLMHQKTAVIEIEIFAGTAAIINTGKLYEPAHLPIGITINGEKPDLEDLNDWWIGRSIPASRQNIKAALQKIGISSTEKLITKCYGLSLSDQYWVNPLESPLKWEDANFFQNNFSEDIGDVLFGNALRSKKINFISPDNTSDGILKKKWKIIDGKRYLIKGGSDPFYQQPFNEAIASAVMKRLNIPVVKYSVIFENNYPYSICENFICSQTELVSAFHIHNIRKIENANQLYEHFIKCCEELKIPDAKINLEKMLTADYLLNNYDRHLSNFGAIRNAETLEWVGIAPNFDSGSSLWCKELTKNIINSKDESSQPFSKNHSEQIKLIKDFSWLNLSALNGIEAEITSLLSCSPFVEEERIINICKAFTSRIENLNSFINGDIT
jgi:hypothetical protein